MADTRRPPADWSEQSIKAHQRQRAEISGHMNKFISRAKMSKKAQRENDKAQRVVWGNISPVTQKIESKKVYNRKKVRREKDDFYFVESFILSIE